MTKTISAFLFLGILLSGCSNYLESNQAAIVVGVGIDYDSESDLFEATLQIVNPSGMGGATEGEGGLSFTHVMGTGKTLGEAARNTSKSFSRRNLYSHLSVIIISEELAREKGINFMLDIFERDAKTRTNIPIIVARGQTASDVLKILPGIDKIPSAFFVKTIKNTAIQLGENMEVNINDTIAALSSKGKEPVMNGMNIVGEVEKGSMKSNLEMAEGTFVSLNGMAVFRDGYLVDWLDGNKSKSVQILNNKMNNTNFILSCPEKEGTLSVVTKRMKSNATVKYDKEKGKVNIKVDIVGVGYLNELLCNIDLGKPDVLNQVIKNLNKKIKKDVSEGIIFAQNAQSDIYGFGEILHRSDPKQWKKLENNWNEAFASADIEITVKTYLYGTGMRSKAYPF
ncbi:MAG: Ger(x)C family spore germination protein [Bacillota bacterium]